MELLESNIENSINIFWSDTIFVRPVLSQIFKTCADKLDNGIMLENIRWRGFNKTSVIWAEDLDKNILGGLVYKLDKTDNGMTTIILDFLNYRPELYKLCYRHLEKKSKEAGQKYIVTTLHEEDTQSIQLSQTIQKMTDAYYIIIRNIKNSNG